MSSLRNVQLFAAFAVLPVSGIGARLEGQAMMEVKHAVGAEVPAVMALRRQTAPKFRGGLTARTSTEVQVGANARFDVLVALDRSTDDAAVVFVRDAGGVFRRLDRERPVVVALGAPAGVSTITIDWRAESIGSRGASPAIRYVLVESNSAPAATMVAARNGPRSPTGE